MPSLQACVLAAGKGTRMGGSRPKVLFEAAGKPLIEWVLGALSDAGVADIVVVVGFGKDEVVAKLPTGVRWAEQLSQLGTGHAVRCARSSFQDDANDILVTCGDMPLITASTYRALADLRRSTDADAALLTVPITPDSRFGRIVRSAAGDVTAIVEFKDATPDQRAITEGNAGLYCFRASALWPALDQLKSDNAQGELYLTDVISIFIRQGGRVAAMRSSVPGEELGVNTPSDLALCDQALSNRRRQNGR